MLLQVSAQTVAKPSLLHFFAPGFRVEAKHATGTRIKLPFPVSYLQGLGLLLTARSSLFPTQNSRLDLRSDLNTAGSQAHSGAHRTFGKCISQGHNAQPSSQNQASVLQH